MRVSSKETIKAGNPFAISMEENIAYQLALIGLQLRKLGRADLCRRIIDARNDLLDILDEEFVPPPKNNKDDHDEEPAIADQSAIAASRSKRALKASDRAR